MKECDDVGSTRPLEEINKFRLGDIMASFLEILIIMVSFSDFWIKKLYDNKKEKLVVILQLIFIALFSVMLTVFLLIGLIVVIVYWGKYEFKGGGELFWLMSGLIFFWLCTIYYLNMHMKVNIPSIIIELSVIVANLKVRKRVFGLLEMVIYIIFTISIPSILLILIFSLSRGELIDSSGMIMSLIVSGAFSIALYSEITFDRIDRAIRQLNLWATVFIVLVSLSVLNLQSLLEDSSTNPNFVAIGLLIFGLYYNFATIADKCRTLIELCRCEYKDQIQVARLKLNELNSYEEEINETILNMKYVKLMWLVGGWKGKLRIVFSVIIGILFYIFALWFMKFMEGQSLIDFF